MKAQNMVKILLGECPANLLLRPGKLFNLIFHPSLHNIEFRRTLHGVGQCSVDVRAILQGHCPNIQTFCGINLREASGRIKSKQQVRKLLHKDYVARGGAMELKLWSKKYWRGRAVVMAQGRRRRLFDVCAMMWTAWLLNLGTLLRTKLYNQV